MPNSMTRKVLVILGTRPEVIKLAPVIRALAPRLATVVVASGQHAALLYLLAEQLGVRFDHDIGAMQPNQTPNALCARILAALDDIVVREAPGLVLVQGDTTTALAGALAAFHRRIPIGHVEAGLRSGQAMNPYPEEMNRRLIGQLATYHFAATSRNRDALLAEGVDPACVFVTGNPVVDSLKAALRRAAGTNGLGEVLDRTGGRRCIVLTTHRRESFGAHMAANLAALRAFIDRHADVALIFPVHPNPAVARAAACLAGHPRAHLIEPLGYDAFVALLTRAWVIVSDSGGIQEEAPTLGKPLLVLRETTERPEVLECGIARLTGGRPERLTAMLEDLYATGGWGAPSAGTENPFGTGTSGPQIAEIIARLLSPPRIVAPIHAEQG
jgi:UDP-N-acetylglucosamine 2-epimerase (non-hydrolysing)